MATYYIAGNFNGWNAAGTQFVNDSVGIVNLSPGWYECKVTGGAWGVTEFSANELDYTCTPACVTSNGGNSNIYFELAVQSDVTFKVVKNGTKLCVSGTFVDHGETLPDLPSDTTSLPTYITNGTAPSGSLPIVYINTTTGSDITDRDNYVSATCYIDSVLPKYPSLGSQQSPLTIQVRGRGNWTWTGFDKKPYKIKFAAGQKPLDMHKSKHWALMASADDNLGFLRMPVGFMVSKAVGLRWTPKQKPVELVLNGRYMGLYFLTETIRIDNKRVNIHDQEDNLTDPTAITGGWLVEIDNYPSPGNVVLTEGNGETVMITMHTPEVLSTEQYNYISAQMNALNTAFYEPTSTHWEQLLDIDEAVKFYLVQEIMEDCESYHGSCYLYKDQDSTVTAKWNFGPVWDFGNAFNRHSGQYIYQNPIWPQYWIGQLASFPAFQSRLMEYWYLFYHNAYPVLRDDILSYTEKIDVAAKDDAARWNGYNTQTAPNMTQKERDMWNNIEWRVEWLHQQWGDGTPCTLEDLARRSEPESNERVLIRLSNGQLVILRDGHQYTLTGLLIE